MSDRVRIFSSGSEFADWESLNCGHCKKSGINNPEHYYTAEGHKNPLCTLDEALTEAYWDDGTVSIEQARRLGYVDGMWIADECTEKEQIDDDND